MQNKYRRWTKNEDKKLKRMYSKKTMYELAEIFNRTPQKVVRRAKKIGLKKRKNDYINNLRNGIKNGKKREYSKRICLLCKIEYIPTSTRQKYCHSCSKEHLRRIRREIERLNPLSRYKKCLNGAKVRAIEFRLSENEYIKEISKPCAYCGETSDINGLDRIDSSKGYTINNINSCCSMCNRMKSVYSKDAFIKKCKIITKYNES